jgi:hypothetical protein
MELLRHRLAKQDAFDREEVEDADKEFVREGGKMVRFSSSATRQRG